MAITTTAKVLVIFSTALLTLSACGSTSSGPSEGAESEVEANEDLQRSKDADYECGQVSMLGILDARIRQGLSNPGSDPNADTIQNQMLDDLWLSIMPQDSPVSSLVRKAQDAVSSDDPDELGAVVQDLTALCTANGNPLEVMGLPGEGG